MSAQRMFTRRKHVPDDAAPAKPKTVSLTLAIAMLGIAPLMVYVLAR